MTALRIAVATYALAIAPCQAQTSINFDGVPVNRAADFLFAAQGVTFAPNVFIGTNLNNATAPAPHSGTQLAHLVLGEFAGAVPISFDFSNGQTHVAFYGCSSTPRTTGVAKAFDQSRNVVAQVGPLALSDRVCQTLFDLRSSTPNIVHVEFNVLSGTAPAYDLAVDDLSFEGGQPPPSVPTDVPVITITVPTGGVSVDTKSLTVTGTVTGNGLLPSLLLTTVGTSAADFSVQLSGAGTARTFSQTVPIPLGNVTIIAKEENTGGKQGTATVTLLNLPSSLRDPSGSRGSLQRAIDLSPFCRIAIYPSSAIASVGAKVFAIESQVFAKWSSWERATSHSVPGGLCPTENAHAVESATSRQNFVGGRIYFGVSASPFYVPKVFADAIDVLGGEGSVGVPLSDPQSAPLAHVYLFQRYSRAVGGLPTTLEIKGLSPKLWVERQGGDLTILNHAHQSLAFRTATWAEQFKCTAIYGPCDVAPATSGAPISNSGSSFCHGTSFPNGVDEWVPVLTNTTPTLLEGWVSESRHAGQDWSGSHEFPQSDPAFSGWADWNVMVHPLHPFRNLATETEDSVEVEFEWRPAAYFFTLVLPSGPYVQGPPYPGDLYITAGRWIIDCGHNPPASAEIHPPFATATVRTVGSLDNPFTSAGIWVNGYYRGGAPIEFLLFPPPHPAPNAVLNISRTTATNASYDVNVIDMFDPGFTDDDGNSYVRVRFTASARLEDVAGGFPSGGLMKFKSGREYIGFWTVGWQIDSTIPVGTLGPYWWP
jgi:hypothetical protein